MTAENAAAVPHTNIPRGVSALIGAVFFFSFADAIGKWFGHAGYDSFQIVFMRYMFGLIPVAIAIFVSGVGGLRTKRPGVHLLRALLMFAALTFFFRGLKFMPLAEGIAVAFSAPLFVTTLSYPILRERVGPFRWGAVIVGFAGALIILQPGTDAFRPEALYIVAAALFFALAVLTTRKISVTETNVAMYTYSTVFAGLATLPALPFVWVAPQTNHIGLFLLLGLIAGAASYLMIVAYRNSPAAVNAPFDYTALIWGALMGWIVWNETPGANVWIGTLIVVAAGLTITYRETRAGVSMPRRGR